MAKFQAGESVVAVKSFGGAARPRIEQGTQGVVVESGWGVLKVKFLVKSFWSGDKPLVVDVSEDEIR